MHANMYRKEANLLLVLVVALAALSACGPSSMGATTMTSTSPPSAGAAPSAVPTMAATRMAETSPPITATSSTTPQAVSTLEDLISALRQAGAMVDRLGAATQTGVSVSGTTVRVNQASVQVFAYPDDHSAEMDMARISDILAGRGTMIIDWVASPHFYRAGRLIALYVGDDRPTLDLLAGVLGAPFAQAQMAAPRAQTSMPDASAPRLQYFWPTQIPSGMVIQPAGSAATEVSFTLQLADPAGGQAFAAIDGGAQAIAPPPQGSQPITIRGQSGVAFTTGGGYTIYWQEAGQPYAIVSGLGLEQARVLAEGLEALDLTTWRERLRQNGGASQLRLTNTSSFTLDRVVVIFPNERLTFEAVPAGATTDYQRVQNGVYETASFEATLEGRAIRQPVADWLGATPLPSGAYTYVLTVVPQQPQGLIIHYEVRRE